MLALFCAVGCFHLSLHSSLKITDTEIYLLHRMPCLRSYNIILQLGCKLLHLTPSRGFAAELAAGLTISLASFYGERSQGRAARANCRG